MVEKVSPSVIVIIVVVVAINVVTTTPSTKIKTQQSISNWSFVGNRLPSRGSLKP